MSDSSTSMSARTISATRAARRSLSPNRISAVATVSFSLITGMQPSAEQRRQRGAGVEVAAAIFGIVQRQQQLRRGHAAAPTAPRSRPAPAGSGRPPRPPAFPPASTVFGSGRAPGAPARWRRRRRRSPRCRARAARRYPAATPASQAVRGAAAFSSTTSALPILTTTRRAVASDGVMPPPPASRHGSRSAARAAPPARPGRSRRTAASPAGPTLCATPPRAPRFPAASWRRSCSGRSISGLSARPPP